MIISFVNYSGDKIDFFKSTQTIENNNITKMNNINFSNFLHSKIYDSFLSIPIQIHFINNIQKIFKKKTLYIKDIYYKNYYLIDLNNNKIILNYNSLYNNNNQELKIFKFRKIWKELLSRCHTLKKNYMEKNKMAFNSQEYQNFFTKIEYKATYPRRSFIIKFLPICNGFCIIHEYIELKLSTFEGEEKNKKTYKERDIIYGYNVSEKLKDNDFFENEHFLLKQIHYFLIETLFCSNTNINDFFILEKNEKIYFSDEILKIINREIDKYMENNKILNKYLKSNEHNYYLKKLIQIITKTLYEEYIQINNTEKIIHRSSSALPLKSIISNVSLKDIKINKNDNSSFQITKNETLTYLFNSIKFNKNINPNDITIDLNDDKKSENVKYDYIRASELIDRNSKPSIRLSDLLSEKISNNPSHENYQKIVSPILNCPFPKDSENIEYKTREQPFIDRNHIDYEEMSIGTKIKKKYYYNFDNNNNNNYKNYKMIKNINENKKINNNKNDGAKSITFGESSVQRCLIDKTSLQNLNNINLNYKSINDK